MTLLRTALIWDINLTYQARVPKSEPTDYAQPDEKRLSCAAVLCCSQKQFYYDGRRQLQPLVRQTRDDTEQSPTEIRQELWPSVRQGIP